MLLKAVVVFGVLLPIAWGSVSFQLVTPKEGKPDECPLDDGTVLKVGKWKGSDKECARSECFKLGDKLAIEHQSCGAVSLPKHSGCTLVSDDSKPYPECCPEPKCEGKKEEKKEEKKKE